MCLIAALLASVGQASPIVCCPAVAFSPNVVSYPIKAEGELWPIGKKIQTHRKTYPVGHKFTFDPTDVQDAVLQASMLAGAVKNEPGGIRVGCGYCCDTEFGCDDCIPKDLVATPAEKRSLIEGSVQLPNVSWFADTGSAQDLITDSEFPDEYGYMSNDPVRLITANGESSSLKQGKVYIPSPGKDVDPYLVESTPAVLSVGMRCVDDGYDFVWRGSKKQDPYFLKPNGERIYLKVNDYVPYLTNEGSRIGVSATAFKGAIVKPMDSVPSVDKSDEVLEAAEKIDEGMYEPSAAGEAPDIEELQGDEPLERGYVEAPREGESFELSFDTSVGSSSSVLDVDVKAKRDLGEKALRKEAQSKGHLLTHLPKNPYCDVCTKAKMIKPPSRAKGGSTRVEADVFGDHITGDFLVIMTGDIIGY